MGFLLPEQILIQHLSGTHPCSSHLRNKSFSISFISFFFWSKFLEHILSNWNKSLENIHSNWNKSLVLQQEQISGTHPFYLEKISGTHPFYVEQISRTHPFQLGTNLWDTSFLNGANTPMPWLSFRQLQKNIMGVPRPSAVFDPFHPPTVPHPPTNAKFIR